MNIYWMKGHRCPPWFTLRRACVTWALRGPAASGGASVLSLGSRVRRRVLRGLCLGLLPPGDLSASPWFTR